MSAERETFAGEHREVERPAGAARARLLLGFLVLGSVAALEALRAGLTPPMLVGEPDSALPVWGNAALALGAFLGPVFAASAPRRWAIALLVLGPLWGVLNVAAGGTNVPWLALALGLPLVVPPLLRLTRAQVAAALEEDAALRLRRLRQGTPGWVMIYLGCAAPGGARARSVSSGGIDRMALDSDSAWQVPHEPARVFSRAPQAASPELGYLFHQGDDLYQVETRWQATPEGWRLAQLSIEREQASVK